MSVPAAPDIALDALRAGLRRAGLDERFMSLSAEYLGRFSNDVWRLDLDNGVRLLAKRAWKAARELDPPDAERAFYRHMARYLGLPIPRFVADLDGVLVMEYVELEPFDFRRGVEPAHARAALSALASWHVRWWGRAPEVRWLPSYARAEVRDAMQRSFDVAWARHRRALLGFAPEFGSVGDALVGRLSATLEPLATPATLIHGDAHAENLRPTRGGVLLLDWQEPRVGNPGLDLAVFTSMSFRESDREAVERELVQAHAAHLRQRGCEWPDPWRDYRLGLLGRAARIVEIADPSFISLPWVFRRSARAALANGVAELIR